jgi:hypothetical protein
MNNHATMNEQKGQQTLTSLIMTPFTGSQSVTLLAAHPESRSCRTLQMCTGIPQPLQLPLPNIQART